MPFLHELQKCCFTCRKHFINSHKHHCFLIPHDIDICFKFEYNSLMNQPEMTINHVSQQNVNETNNSLTYFIFIS